VELEFERCKHLAPGCSHLDKEYSFEVGASGEPFLLSSRVTAGPQWASAGLDPTHKQGGDGKLRPASSFFQLFRSGGGKYAFNLAGEDREVQVRAWTQHRLQHIADHAKSFHDTSNATKQANCCMH
jgi:hypothetical protein